MIHEFIAPYSSQQNGIERKSRILKDMMKEYIYIYIGHIIVQIFYSGAITILEVKVCVACSHLKSIKFKSYTFFCHKVLSHLTTC